MNVTHVYNSGERQQYLIEHHYSIRLKPRLLYAGKQFKSGGWEEKTHSHDFSEIVLSMMVTERLRSEELLEMFPRETS